jgi:hypothetical protein
MRTKLCLHLTKYKSEIRLEDSFTAFPFFLTSFLLRCTLHFISVLHPAMYTPCFFYKSSSSSAIPRLFTVMSPFSPHFHHPVSSYFLSFLFPCCLNIIFDAFLSFSHTLLSPESSLDRFLYMLSTFVL